LSIHIEEQEREIGERENLVRKMKSKEREKGKIEVEAYVLNQVFWVFYIL
jgi:hypothetical protein